MRRRGGSVLAAVAALATLAPAGLVQSDDNLSPSVDKNDVLRKAGEIMTLATSASAVGAPLIPVAQDPPAPSEATWTVSDAHRALLTPHTQAAGATVGRVGGDAARSVTPLLPPPPATPDAGEASPAVEPAAAGARASCDPATPTMVLEAAADAVRKGTGKKLVIYQEEEGLCTGAGWARGVGGSSPLEMPPALMEGEPSGARVPPMETALTSPPAPPVPVANAIGSDTTPPTPPLGTARAAPVAAEPPGSAALVVVLTLLALLLPSWLLYRRLSREKSLANPTRVTVFERILACPGITAGALARSVSIDRHTALHHLDVLCGFGMIEGRRVGARLRYYRNGGVFSEDEKRAHVALADPKARAVLLARLRSPGSSVAGLAQSLGVPKSTALWHLQRMRRLGVVREDGTVAPEAVDLALSSV